MNDLIGNKLQWLAAELPSRLSMPGDARYKAATALWAQPVGPMPLAVVHCRTTEDVQKAIGVARDYGLALSVRGGGHHWAGRSLCDGIVIDLTGMKDVTVDAASGTAIVAGGALGSDVAAVADPVGCAVASGACSMVGMAGLTMGGGYGALIGRCGLALDNLLAAEVVLADGRIVIADARSEPDLYWALRGGGGNFGVVTKMWFRAHRIPTVHTGLLVYPLSEARTVLQRSAELGATAPDEFTVEFALTFGPDGAPILIVLPTWCGAAEEGEARTEPFTRIGTPVAGKLDAMSYGASMAMIDPFIVNGRRAFVDTCWVPAMDAAAIDACMQAMEMAPSAGCSIVTHELKGAAARVAPEATAFGLRRHHVAFEIIAMCSETPDEQEVRRHQAWTKSTLHAFDAVALPGGYPNMLDPADLERVALSYGSNAARLLQVKRRYDAENVFRSAIPLPAAPTTAGTRAAAAKS